MKRILALLLVVFMILGLVACGSGNEQLGSGEENIGGTTQQTDSVGDSSSDADETLDAYVGAFMKFSGNNIGYVITESGETEELGDVGNIAYTADGEYVVWNDKNDLYIMQAGKSKELLADNASAFYLQSNTGVLISFCDDGIFATSDLSKEMVKIADAKDCYLKRISLDGQTLACIGSGNLYTVNLSTLTVTELVSTSVDRDLLICRSENEIYFETEENVRKKWDGASVSDGSTTVDVESTSPNGEYVILKENYDYYRYKITNNGLEERTEFTEYSQYFVSDDGIVGAELSEEIWLFNESEKIVLNGTLSGYYFQSCPPISERTLYYMDGSKLMAYNIDERSNNAIAENVKSYQVRNGYCYYLTTEEDVYRVGINEKITSDPVYSNALGFVY